MAIWGYADGLLLGSEVQEADYSAKMPLKKRNEMVMVLVLR